jgi:hypothetical protein
MAMRSCVAYFIGRRRPAARRAEDHARTQARVRFTDDPSRRDRRQAAAGKRGPAFRSLTALAGRAPLSRVRPLKCLPRGVVPYLKH